MTRMRSCLTIASLTIGIAGATALTAQAQTTRSHAGFHGTYNFDVEDFGVGGQVTIPVGSYLQFYPSADIYFVDAGSLWAVNADLKYAISGENLNWLYVGGGLNLTTASAGGASDTQAGLNLIAGVESLKSNVHPYAEVRFTVGDGSSGQVAVGLNFTLGRH